MWTRKQLARECNCSYCGQILEEEREAFVVVNQGFDVGAACDEVCKDVLSVRLGLKG